MIEKVTSNEPPNTKYRELLRMATEAQSLLEELHDKLPTNMQGYPVCQEFKFDSIELIDSISLLTNELVSKLDGRPDPFDLSSLCVGGNCSQEVLRRLQLWGECCDPGCEDKAYIGGHQFNLSELIDLRNWLDQTIKFHSENTNRIRPVDFQKVSITDKDQTMVTS